MANLGIRPAVLVPEDEPAPPPFRQPTHTVALAVRDGRAILGIVHADEVLAATRLTPAEAAAFAERVAGLLPTLGVDPAAVVERVAARLGVNLCPAPAPVEMRRCADCGGMFGRMRASGRVPSRCPACARAHMRAWRREWEREHRGRGGAVRCRDCGADITPPLGTVGVRPERCRPCKLRWNAQKKRESKQKARRRGA